MLVNECSSTCGNTSRPPSMVANNRVRGHPERPELGAATVRLRPTTLRSVGFHVLRLRKSNGSRLRLLCSASTVEAHPHTRYCFDVLINTLLFNDFVHFDANMEVDIRRTYIHVYGYVKKLSYERTYK